jgi:hypothetical protein
VRARLLGVSTVLVVSLVGPAAAAQEPADVCLELVPGALPSEDWASVSAAVADAVAERSTLFPSPVLALHDARLDIRSGLAGLAEGGASCLQDGYGWTSRIDRLFLEAGADRMLAEAPTTPGIDSAVTIEWVPTETRVRTRLQFAGPLDIPNGRCWVDDALSVDPATGTVAASGEHGLETSPFAEGACGRFFDHLPEGGAGEQAVTLLPRAVVLAGGSELRFVAEVVSVTDDAVTVSGRLVRD